MRQFRSAGLVVGLLGLMSTACSIDVRGEGVVSRDEKRFMVTGDPELSLQTFDGSITVRSWDQKDVRVEIERRGRDAQAAAALVVNVTQTGNRIVVDAPSRPKVSGLFGPWSSGAVSLIVTTPKRVTLDAHSGDGSISTDGVVGGLVLNTGDGSVDVIRADGRVKVHTGDGSIRISGASGSVEADTGDGAIDLAGRLEGLSLHTGDGSIRITAEAGSLVTADWNVTTGDGSIDVRVPAAFDAELDAHTGSGGVEAKGLDGVSGRSDDDRRNLSGRLGAGGHTLRLRSGDGLIVISR